MSAKHTPSKVLAAPMGAVVMAAAIAGCAEAVPPTVTPAPATETPGVTSIEIPINPPPGSTVASAPREVPPAVISSVVSYRDADGRFSLDVPQGWTESRQPPAREGSSVVLGTVFQPQEANGLISVTQFDSGRRPSAVGSTANEVLQMSGVMDRPGYVELGREQVIERPDDALRVEIAYTRSDGTPIHSLVLFQIDGTTFSMVHMGVEESSWLANEGAVRDVLASYRAPAVREG